MRNTEGASGVPTLARAPATGQFPSGVKMRPPSTSSAMEANVWPFFLAMLAAFQNARAASWLMAATPRAPFGWLGQAAYGTRSICERIVRETRPPCQVRALGAAVRTPAHLTAPLSRSFHASTVDLPLPLRSARLRVPPKPPSGYRRTAHDAPTGALSGTRTPPAKATLPLCVAALRLTAKQCRKRGVELREVRKVNEIAGHLCTRYGDMDM